MGQLISKSKEKLWDIDIKNFTVSPLDQIKCSTASADIKYEWSPEARLLRRGRGLLAHLGTLLQPRTLLLGALPRPVEVRIRLADQGGYSVLL